MKKTLFAALAVLCVAVLVPQTLEAGVGIKGGMALSKFAMKPADVFPFPLVNLPAPVGGVYFDLGLGPLSFEADVFYARTGMKGTFEGATVEYRLDYIQVPVLLKIKVIPAGPLRPFISAGGYGAYLLSAKGVMTGVPSEDIGDMFEKTDYGVVGGVGVEFKLPGLKLTAEGRYNFGLANIGKDAGEGESAKNRSIMALVGIGF